MSNGKRNTLLVLVSAGLLVLLLAMGLPGLVLAPSQPYSLGNAPTLVPGESGTVSLPGDGLVLAIRGLLALMLIVLPAYVVYSLLTSKGRQRLLGDVLALAVLMLAASYFSNLPRHEQIGSLPAAGGDADFGSVGSPGPIPTFSATPPSWLTLAIILAVSVLVVALGIAAVVFFRARTMPSRRPFERLSDHARRAMESLQAGNDLGDTIVICYREMSRVLEEERGIARGAAMTPREFELGLIDQGYPRDAIQTLTRLFEQVRYGHVVVGAEEERRAAACLAEIANACVPGRTTNAQEN